MYVLKRENVERIVTESQKDRLLAQGFTLVSQSVSKQEKFLDDEKTLEDMTVEELQAYAEAHDIDLGRATSKGGIIEKIQNKG